MEFKPFGWRHFEANVPEDWGLTKEGGSKGQGFFQLEDRYNVRMEVAWQYAPFEKAPDPYETFNNYVKDLGKKMKKLKLLEPTLVKKEEYEVYGHEGMHGLFKAGVWVNSTYIWYCEIMEKMFTLTLLHKVDEEFNDIERQIVESIKCHYKPGEKALWTMYKMGVRIPADFYLVSARFTTGLSYILWRNKEEQQVLLSVFYAPFSSRILRDFGSVDKLLNKFVKKDILGKYAKFGKIKSEEKKLNGLRGHEFSSSIMTFSFDRIMLKGYLFVSEKDRLLGALIVFPKKKCGEKAQKTIKNVLNQLLSHT